MEENKNIPENGEELELQEEILADDDFYSAEPAGDDAPDEDLDISELLKKYLPDYADMHHAEPEPDPVFAPVTDEEAADAPAEEPEEIELPEIPDISSGEYNDGAEFVGEAADEVESLFGDAISDAEEYYSEEEPVEEEYVEEEVPEAEYAEEEVLDEVEYAEEEEYLEETDSLDEYAYVEGAAEEFIENAAADEEPAEGEASVSQDEEAAEDEIPGGLDATDINLMVAFGLDDELDQTMGPEMAKKLREEISAEAREHEEKHKNTVENEYVDETQTADFAAALKSKFSRLKVKILFSVILTAILLLYENISVFGIQFSGALDPAVYPVVYTMVSLQILLICSAVAYEQVLRGCIELFTGKLSPYSVTFIANIAAVVYSAILADTTVIGIEPVMLNSCVALMDVFTLIYDYYITKKDIFSFNVISSKRPKYCVTHMSAEDADIPEELMSENAPADSVLRIEKAAFVDGFFSRSTKVSPSGKTYSAAFLGVALVAAAIVGAYVGISGKGGGVSVTSAIFTTLFAALPVSMFVSMGYPFYKASSDAYDVDGAIIGETSAEEYSNASAICFDDVDAFPSYGVKVQRIKIFNNHRIDRVLYYAASAFKSAGGPLSDVFEVATMEIGTSEDVTVTAADAGFLSADVDGKSIVFGSSDVLAANGYIIPEVVTDEDASVAGDASVMYMLREGKLMAKLFIDYILDSDFEFLIKNLYDNGMSVCIKTFDPNINDDLVTRKLGGGKYPFCVSRYTSVEEISRLNDKLSSGIVSRGSSKSVIEMIASCPKILSMKRTGFVIGMVSSVVAALVVLIMIIAGGFAKLSSLLLVIYGLFWLIPVFFMTRAFMKIDR